MLPAAAASEAGAAYLELGAALVILALAARVAIRLDLPTIGFYLLGGLAIGALDTPQLPGQFVELTAQLGVVLLLFLLGLEYTADELRTNLRAHAPAGFVDAALNFTPGFAAGLVIGWGVREAVLLGGVTWISSSGIVAKTLKDLGRVGHRETPAILSVLVTEDLAMAAYLPLVASLLVGGGLFAAVGSLAVGVAAAAAALALALRYGHHIDRLVDHESEEVALLTALALVLIVAGLAQRVQISAAVGAFLLGIALSGEVAQRTHELLAPIRDVSAALFFLFFGLTIDTGSLGGVLAPAAALALVTAPTKIATGWWAARRAGIGREGCARAGAALVARGEFSIVIAGLGVSAGMRPELASLAAGYTLALALAGPVLAKHAHVALPVIDALDHLAMRSPFHGVVRRLERA